MSASFPTGIKSFTTKLAGDPAQAGHINDLQLEVTAIETAMVGGTLPAANGSALTALNASNLSSGTVAEARMATTSTFTPAPKFGGASTGLTTSAATTGTAFKIGTLVYFTLRVTFTAKGSSTGDFTITDLPYTAATLYTAIGDVYFFNLTASVADVKGYIVGGTTAIQMVYTAAAGATGMVNLDDADLSGTSDFIISGCYRSV